MIDADRQKQDEVRDPEEGISQEELEAERAGALRGSIGARRRRAIPAG